MSSDRYHGLDGMRGLCALIVAAFHFDVISHFNGAPIISQGPVFVDFFFVLSGFVVSHAYSGRLSTLTDAATFMVKRFARLWPLHFSILAAFIALECVFWSANQIGFEVGREPFSEGKTLAGVISNVFLVHSMSVHSELTWNEPSWSISVEFWTYSVFAAVLLVFRTRAWIAAMVIVAISAIALLIFAPEGMGSTYDYGFVRCLYGFFLGLLVRRLPSRAFGTVSEASIIALLVAAVLLTANSDVALLLPVLFAAAVYVFAGGGGFVSRLLETSPIQALGRWSYSIYMTHLLVIVCVLTASVVANRLGFGPYRIDVDGQKMLSFGSAWVGDAAMVAYLGVVVLISRWTYTLIELRGQRLLNGVGPSSRSTPVPATHT